MNSRRLMISMMVLFVMTASLRMGGTAAAFQATKLPAAPNTVIRPVPVPTPVGTLGNITASLYPAGVVLNWAPVPNAIGYSVSRTPTSEWDNYYNYSFPTSVTQPTFQENLCLPGATLTYTLSAVFADGHAGPPATVTYTLPPPPSPITLTATPEIGGPVTLRWQPPPMLPYSYWLQGPGLPSQAFVFAGVFAVAPQSVTQYLVNAAQNLPGGTYTYSVYAQYGWDCEVRGNPAQATVALRGAAPHTAWLTRLDPHPGQFDASKNMDVDAVLGAQYLATIGGAPNAKNTLDQWKQANGFNQRRIIDGAPLRAVYFNAGDLNLGREMHCNQTGQIVACYVSNYQLAPFSADEANVQATLAGAISGIHDVPHGYLATVAMEVSLANPLNVKFYVYNNTDAATTTAILDTETGPQNHFTGGYSPFNCLACHGGNYNPATNTVTGAAFLPFDVYSFRYSTQPGYTQADQEESLRRLNALVRSTRPNLPSGPDGIVTFIDGMYAGQVGVPGAKANNTWIPAGWAANPNMYTGIVKPFCRTCHLAMSGDLQFSSYDRFRAMSGILQAQLCSGGMPQAEVPFRKFWQNPNVSYIAYLQDPSVLGLHCN